MLKAFIIALLAILGLVAMSHFVWPVVAGSIAVGTGVWTFLVGSIIAFCAFIMAMFVIAGVGVYIMAIFATVWFVVAVAMLPIFLPILLPLLVIVFFLTFVRRRSRDKN